MQRQADAGPRVPIDLAKGLFVMLSVWVLSIVVLNEILPKLSDRGVFGDSFGMINSLFSGFALSGVAYTLYLQRQNTIQQNEQIRLAKSELRLTTSSYLRQLHNELLKMSIADPKLAEVWGLPFTDHDQYKRHVFVNMILANWEMQFAQQLIDEHQLTALLDAHFRHTAFQDFWRTTRDYRRRVLSQDAANIKFHEAADEQYRRHTNQPG